MIVDFRGRVIPNVNICVVTPLWLLASLIYESDHRMTDNADHKKLLDMSL